MPVYFNQTARHHIKGNTNLFCHRHENFKPQISSLRQYDDEDDDDVDIHNVNDYRSNEEDKQLL